VRTFAYPHTIENGSGERLTFLRRVPGINGDRIEGENLVLPGAGPPMHVHHHQEEGFTVLEGRIGYQRLGEPVQFAEVGESLVFAKGEPHRFWNAGTGNLRCSAYIEPADNIEYFLTEIFASQARAGNGRPGLLESAYLARRYRSEFSLLEIPAMVQRFVFPVLIAIGSALGRYRRYKDAPEPLYR
jgi:mannose-6-phosphate isomerase-like protein (cupin superfamily)